jgi:Secretory lipase
MTIYIFRAYWYLGYKASIPQTFQHLACSITHTPVLSYLMQFIFRFLPLVASVATIALAAPVTTTPTTSSCAPSASATQSSNIPIAPSQDSWYRAPDGWQTAQPGAILRIRTAPGNVIAKLEGFCYQAWNILYRTTDSHYNPSWAVTTVFSPSIASKPHALISYQHSYDSASLDDSPSYQIYSSSELQTLVVFYLAQGWYVNVPDFEGPNAAFGAGVLSGHATLDSIRAAKLASQRADPLRIDIPTDAQYIMYGYSGGSFATEWAAELQVQYAPELQFAGAGIGRIYPDITSALLRLSLLSATYQNWAWHLSNLTVGIGNGNPDAQTVAMTILGKQNWADAVQAVRAMAPNQLQAFVSQLLRSATVQAILNRDGMMGYHGVPQMPLLIQGADQDGLSSTADTAKLYSEYCRVGANIYYHINPTQMSDPFYNDGVSGFVEWAVQYFPKMLAGTFPKGCQTIIAALS